MKLRGIRNGKASRSFLGVSTVLGILVVFTIAVWSRLDYADFSLFSDIIDEIGGYHYCIPGDLSLECIDYEASKIARVFPFRDPSTWCLAPNMIPVRKNTILRQGLILTKVPKSASSTSAGVALRITDRNHCHSAQWEHRLGSFYSGRLRDKSFLFTSIRAPDDRAISSIFYHKFSVVRRSSATRPTDLNILRELQGGGRLSHNDHSGTLSPGQGGFALQYASMTPIPAYSAWDEDKPELVQSPEVVIRNVRSLVDDYDMMLVVDRMDESLVALSLILGVDVGDVVVADSKITGETYRMWKHKPVEDSFCVPTLKSFVSDTVRGFFTGDRWRASNYGDYILHAAADKSLDLTIDSLGRERFESSLAEYRRLKAMVDEQCADQIHLPCGPDGQLQLDRNEESCFVKAKDFGCAHACVDKLFDATQPVHRSYAYIRNEGSLEDFKASLYDKRR